MKSLQQFILERNSNKSIEDFLEQIVSTAKEQPEVWDDTGNFHVRDLGEDNFDTTDGKSFDWVEHVQSHLNANTSIVVWPVKDESDFPSDEIKQLFESGKKTEALKMGGYFVKCSEGKYESSTYHICIATVNEDKSIYLFLILE